MRTHRRLGEGLFDEEQAELVEAQQVREVTRPVDAVGIDLKGKLVAEPLPHRAQRGDVPPGLNLELDPQVAVGEVAAHHVE